MAGKYHHIIALLVHSCRIHLKNLRVTFLPFFMVGLLMHAMDDLVLDLIVGLVNHPTLGMIIIELFNLLFALSRVIAILAIIHGLESILREPSIPVKNAYAGTYSHVKTDAGGFLFLILFNYFTATGLPGGSGNVPLLSFGLMILLVFLTTIYLLIYPVFILDKKTRGAHVFEMASKLESGRYFRVFLLLVLIAILMLGGTLIITAPINVFFNMDIQGITIGSLLTSVLVGAFAEGLFSGLLPSLMITVFYWCAHANGRITVEKLPAEMLIVTLEPEENGSDQEIANEPWGDGEDEDEDLTTIVNHCPSCGTPIPIYKNKCPNCDMQVTRCPRCAMLILGGMSRCPHCTFEPDEEEKNEK